MYVKLNTGQLLSIKRLKNLRTIIPSDLRIRRHFQEELLIKQNDSSYKPSPMLLEVADEAYDEIIKEMHGKAKFYDFGFIVVLKSTKFKPILLIKKEGLDEEGMLKNLRLKPKK